jgi:undecaprenyl-diphosphatase
MDRLASIDLGAHFFFQHVRQDLLDPKTFDPIMRAITHAGDSITLMIVAPLACLAFLAAKRPRTAFAILLSALLGISISESVKRLVNRERPPDVTNPAVEKPKSPSFPSGHSLGSMSIYGAIGLGLAQLMPSRRARYSVIFLGFLFSFLIGLSRLYLGVHFVFDVVGGWTAGLACVLLGHWFDVGFARTQSPGDTKSLATAPSGG